MMTLECFLCFMAGFTACILLGFLSVWFFVKIFLPQRTRFMGQAFKDEVIRTLRDVNKDNDNPEHH